MNLKGKRAKTMAELIPRAMWLVTAAAIVGACLNVKKRRSGFAVWTVTNLLNAGYCLWIGQPAQALLFGVFLGLAVWGWIAWRAA